MQQLFTKSIFLLPLVAHSNARAIRARSPTSNFAAGCNGYTSPEFLCINRYGSTLPLDFQRVVDNNIADPDTYASTSVPGDASFKRVNNATFLIWDEGQASQILGPNPTYDFMFAIAESGHEAPV